MWPSNRNIAAIRLLGYTPPIASCCLAPSILLLGTSVLVQETFMGGVHKARLISTSHFILYSFSITFRFLTAFTSPLCSPKGRKAPHRDRYLTAFRTRCGEGAQTKEINNQRKVYESETNGAEWQERQQAALYCSLDWHRCIPTSPTQAGETEGHTRVRTDTLRSARKGKGRGKREK